MRVDSESKEYISSKIEGSVFKKFLKKCGCEDLKEDVEDIWSDIDDAADVVRHDPNDY